MQPYREKLWPSPWVFVATALVIPASILVFAPINFTAGVFVAIGLFCACVATLIALSPVLRIDVNELEAGKAHIGLDLLGEPEAFSGDEAFTQRGPALDARAYLVLRGWIGSVVKIPVEDPNDPTPYWLISTRRPNDVVAAIQGSRRRISLQVEPGDKP